MKRRANDDERFIQLIQGKNIPILTLDERWHELFPDFVKTSIIRKLEQRVNAYLKEQGRLTQEIKNLKSQKKQLMKDIVTNMHEEDNSLQNSQKGIERGNRRIDELQEELEEIPEHLKEANRQLLLECMKMCYDNIHENRREIEETQEWVKQIRDELKLRILKKQDLEMRNQSIYSYMHDIAGPEVIELFDEHND